MKQIKEHTCESKTQEVSIWDDKPEEWVIVTDYNVSFIINYCPFCGIKL